jgi:uncharacterized protein (TIGR02452 family)
MSKVLFNKTCLGALHPTKKDIGLMVLGSGAAIFSAIILLQLLGSMGGFSHIVGYSLLGTAVLSGGLLILFKGLPFCKGVNKISQKTPVMPSTYPVVSNNMKEGFFVDVLNKRGYLLNDKVVTFEEATPAVEIISMSSLEGGISALRKSTAISEDREIKIQLKDMTTEKAIEDSESFTIALNFANAEHAGGGPGFHRDPETQLFVYDAPSARAQEESLCQRSDLMASLTRLPHTLEADSNHSSFVRSYYNQPFDSTKMAYYSTNHLFAVQASHEFYRSRYLDEPIEVMFITSAGKNYGGDRTKLDCSKGSDVYEDARKRIETHLYAAAYCAVMQKEEKPDQPIELILGAFGCGAFAPSVNPNEYRNMIANIYKELLPHFKGFFDVVTFAVPTFGQTDPSSAAVANHNIFKKVLSDEILTSEVSAVTEDAFTEQYLDNFILFNPTSFCFITSEGKPALCQVTLNINVETFFDESKREEWSKFKEFLKLRMEQFRNKFGQGCVFALNIVASLDETKQKAIVLKNKTPNTDKRLSLLGELLALVDRSNYVAKIKFSDCFNRSEIQGWTVHTLGLNREFVPDFGVEVGGLYAQLTEDWDSQKVYDQLREMSEKLQDQYFEYKHKCKGGEMTSKCVPLRAYLIEH